LPSACRLSGGRFGRNVVTSSDRFDDERAANPLRSRSKNLLGFALMETRARLRVA